MNRAHIIFEQHCVLRDNFPFLFQNLFENNFQKLSRPITNQATKFAGFLVSANASENIVISSHG